MRLSLNKIAKKSRIIEATQRAGERTGTFAFKESEIDRVIKFIEQHKENRSIYNKGLNAQFSSPIDGTAKQIKLIFQWSNQHSSAGEYSPPNEITLYFNAFTNVREIKNTLRHELTHAFDISLNKRLGDEKKSKKEAEIFQSAKSNSIEGQSKYFQHKSEVKAFVDEVVQDMKNYMNQMRGYGNPKELVDPRELLQYSPRWQQISQVYGNRQDLQKLFLKTAFATWNSFR